MPASLYPLPRTGLGQDSHRFVDEANPKPLVLGGLVIPESPGLLANSDGDVLLHALCNAISSVTTVPILGAKADDMCRAGVTDSSAYLKEALKLLEASQNPSGHRLELISLAFSIEGKRPKLLKHIPAMRESIADLCGLAACRVGITATTGEGLTDFGRGLGLQAFCVADFREWGDEAC